MAHRRDKIKERQRKHDDSRGDEEHNHHKTFSGSRAGDREALLVAWRGMGLDVNLLTAAWPREVNKWVGITVGGNNRVTRVDWPMKYLYGAIPSDFSKITSLTYLNLDGNSLQGAIPAAVGDLPKLMYLSIR